MAAANDDENFPEVPDKCVKTVIVGDGGVGKTSMLISYTSNHFPTLHIPTIFENHMTIVSYGEEKIGLELWDTAGQEEYDRLRPLSYMDSQVVLVAFDLTNPDSLENVLQKWSVEVREYCPEAPVILVGTKSDLRDMLAQEDGKSDAFVKTADGERAARDARIEAIAYMECSAKTQQNLHAVFDRAIRAGLPEDVKPKKKGCCVIL